MLRWSTMRPVANNRVEVMNKVRDAGRRGNCGQEGREGANMVRQVDRRSGCGQSGLVHLSSQETNKAMRDKRG